MQPQSLIIYPANKQEFTVLKAFIKSLKIKFDILKPDYTPEFISMIKQGEEDLKNKKGVSISIEELEKLCK